LNAPGMLPTGDRGRLGASGVRSGTMGEEVSMASPPTSVPKLSATVFWNSLRKLSIMPLTSVLALVTEQHVEVDEDAPTVKEDTAPADVAERLEGTERREGAGTGLGGGCVMRPGGGGGGMNGMNGGGPDIGWGAKVGTGGIGGGMGTKPRGMRGRGGIGNRGSTSTSMAFAHGPPRMGASLCGSLSLTMNLSMPVG
jgi:hypothetical protein